MTIKQNNSWLTVLPSLVIPICVGLTMYLGLSYLIEQSILTNELLVRYTTGHPISRFTTGMFFIGVASLVMIAKNVFEQFSTEAKIQLAAQDKQADAESSSQTQISTPSEVTGVTQRATDFQKNLSEYPTWVSEHYLWQRLSAAMAYLQRSDSTTNLETELKYLSELDYERQQQRFALVRILIWATPMLGFLGTVLGISEALGGISVGPENNFETMMNGLRGSLYVAFDTTALALMLSMLLMFGQFLIDRFELQLLSIVDTRVHAEVNRNFDLATTDAPAMKEFSKQFLTASKQAAIDQTKVWKQSIQAAQQAWSSTLTDTNENVQSNLTNALSQNIDQLTTQLSTAIDRADNAMAHRWQQWQVTLSDNCRLLSQHQTQLAEQTSQFNAMLGEKSDNQQYKNAIEQNDQAIEATKQLRETLSTLSESIQTMHQTATTQSQIANQLADTAAKQSDAQQNSHSDRQVVDNKLYETLNTLSESIKTFRQTPAIHPEITNEITTAAAEQTDNQPDNQPEPHSEQKPELEPEPQVFTSKLRVYDTQDTDQSSRLIQEMEILRAAFQTIPNVEPADTPIVMFREREGLNNTTAKDVQIDLPANTHQSSTPDTDVVFQTEFQSEKPTAETLRQTNQRVADFLSNQNRSIRRPSAV